MASWNENLLDISIFSCSCVWVCVLKSLNNLRVYVWCAFFPIPNVMRSLVLVNVVLDFQHTPERYYNRLKWLKLQIKTEMSGKTGEKVSRAEGMYEVTGDMQGVFNSFWLCIFQQHHFPSIFHTLKKHIHTRVLFSFQTSFDGFFFSSSKSLLNFRIIQRRCVCVHVWASTIVPTVPISIWDKNK